LPTGTYDIHDASAIHTLNDLANLGLKDALLFKGVVASPDKLPTTGNVGDVYHVTSDDAEYVWTTNNEWEQFGAHIAVNHTHNVTVTGTNGTSNVSGSATVTGANQDSEVTGTVTVTGTNSTSNIHGSGSVDIPTVTKSAKYAKVSSSTDTFVKSYPGATSKMVTTSITQAGEATSVISSVTPSTGSVTGVSGSTTASKATAGTAIDVAKVGASTTVATGL
jgi:hypothetical protein